MIIDLKLQAEKGTTLPLMPIKVNTSSALPITLAGIPGVYCGGNVESVAVEITNADGMTVTGLARRTAKGWCVLFAATNFATFGFCRYGFRVIVSIGADDSAEVYDVVMGVGDFEVVQASADAEPGEASTAYVRKGADVYLPSGEVDGVQHYVKQVMVYDERVGWGATWEGDYILSASGEFREVTA